MNATIRRERDKHVKRKKPIKETDLLVKEIKKEIKKYQVCHKIQ